MKRIAHEEIQYKGFTMLVGRMDDDWIVEVSREDSSMPHGYEDFGMLSGYSSKEEAIEEGKGFIDTLKAEGR